VAKSPGRLRRDALSHVARGSEGAMYFQWRRHPSPVPRSSTRRWFRTRARHPDLPGGVRARRRPGRARGGRREHRRPGPGGDLLDYQSLWAARLPAHPSADLDALTELKRWYAALWRAGVAVDFAHPAADLSGYRLVLAPALYLLDDAGWPASRPYVTVTGRSPPGRSSPSSTSTTTCARAASRALLGVAVEEVLPLPAGGRATLGRRVDGDDLDRSYTCARRDGGGDVYAAGAMPGYPDGPLAGAPAVTRHRSCLVSDRAWSDAGLDTWLWPDPRSRRGPPTVARSAVHSGRGAAGQLTCSSSPRRGAVTVGAAGTDC
jgi:beta-galactosidase